MTVSIEKTELGLFNSIVNHLITGNTIDSFTKKPMAEALSDPLALEELNQFLSFIGKKCIRTMDGYCFYCVHLDARNHKDRQAQVEKQFAENYNRVMPIVEWLRLIRNSYSGNRVMVSGDEISFSKLLYETENSTLIQKQLKDLMFKIGKSSTDLKDMINDVFKYLVAQEYLVPTGNTGLNYQATGKWSVFYEESEYMLEHNNINYEENPEPEQASFL